MHTTGLWTLNTMKKCCCNVCLRHDFCRHWTLKIGNWTLNIKHLILNTGCTLQSEQYALNEHMNIEHCIVQYEHQALYCAIWTLNITLSNMNIEHCTKTTMNRLCRLNIEHRTLLCVRRWTLNTEHCIVQGEHPILNGESLQTPAATSSLSGVILIAITISASSSSANSKETEIQNLIKEL